MNVYSWIMSNPITQKRITLLYRNILNISVNYNKSVDVGKPYIHYIAVMNKVSRKSQD